MISSTIKAGTIPSGDAQSSSETIHGRSGQKIENLNGFPSAKSGGGKGASAGPSKMDKACTTGKVTSM